MKLKRAISVAVRGVSLGGGVFKTASRIPRILLDEGYSGIRRRIRNIEASGHYLNGGEAGGVNYNYNEWVKKYDSSYRKWVKKYDSVTECSRKNFRGAILELNQTPLISVVMPVYNPSIDMLDGAIRSVRNQLYEHWELCIADDCSTNPDVKEILLKHANEDQRINVVYREENGHISAASNSALKRATGEWIALMDHDDLLSEHALYWVADAVNSHPDAHLIYSDEDKIDETGNRHSPYFKSDWNPDLFYSHNMFSHLGVYRRDLVETVGGFRIGFEGSQDYDLALRCIEQVALDQIHHIPRILYHWRVHKESTAQSADAKPYAMIAGERAINAHFGRQGIDARAELVGSGYRVHYSLPDTAPLVSLIIPTRNGLALIRRCIESIVEKTTYPNYEILVVDNGSDDPDVLDYFHSLLSDSLFRVIRDDRPFNFSALNNTAVEAAKGDVIGLINNDIEVISPDWLSEMVSLALCTGAGAVGARLWYPNHTLQHGGILLGLGAHHCAAHSHSNLHAGHPGYFGRMNLISGYSAVTAACLVIKKSIYKQVGGMNEHELKIAYNDVDFCLRVREAGYQNIWTPYADLYHYESSSRGKEGTPEKQARLKKEAQYMRKCWGELLDNDPAYNPNLALDRSDFSLAFPPRVRHIL